MDPLLARLCLAFWTMAIAAGVMRDGLVTARQTGIEIAAKRCRAAVLNGVKGFELLKTEALVIPV